MDTKLTLSLDEDVIRQAKEFAKEQNTSISKMVESYLSGLTSQEKKKSDIHPLVKELTGIIKKPIGKKQLQDDYADYLEKKYR